MATFKTLSEVIQQVRAKALSAAVSSMPSTLAPDCLHQQINDAKVIIGAKGNLYHLPLLLLGILNL